MNIINIDYLFFIYTFFFLLLGIFLSWFYVKKSISEKLIEKEKIQETFNLLQKKYEILQLEKNELDKQTSMLKQEVKRIPEFEANLALQQKEFSELQVSNATLKERLDSKENESREKLKFWKKQNYL
jgi:hypothetical protein